jgi:hypothetical protein
MVLMNELVKTKHKPKSLKRISLNDSSLVLRGYGFTGICFMVDININR